MTTDTPRTEALLDRDPFGAPSNPADIWNLARTLERDLRECVELLEGIRDLPGSIGFILERVNKTLSRLKETL